MYVNQDTNPTRMYFHVLRDLLAKGDKAAPRGKSILEVRPACLEFHDPYNRVTFLNGRRVNPFFQVAESLWIVSGRADVDWLEKFNSNITQFSDDGKWFNAPYGERMRTWNKNALHNIIINPIDQLMDVYVKITADPDTRQAVIVLSNPMFDNSNYTVGEHGKDIACNLCVTFKVRDNKLHMTVFNRSNDIHWGVFGANLCQFTTIQEVLLNWLRQSGVPQLANLEMGTYSQITDSLHVYLDDYGSRITDQVMGCYQTDEQYNTLSAEFKFGSEPRMSLGMAEFDAFLSTFWGVLNPYLMDDEFILDPSQRESVFDLSQNSLLRNLRENGAVDDYWSFAIQSMLAYRLAKLGHAHLSVDILMGMVDCQWKVSMLHFLKPFLRKLTIPEDNTNRVQRAFNDYTDEVFRLGAAVTPESRNWLISYLGVD